MADEFVIRPLQDRDIPAMVELFNLAFGRAVSPAWASWRYLDASGAPAPAMLAFRGDRLAASYTTWPVEMRVGARLCRGVQSMDTMTHPDFRGRGLFVRLANACFEQLAGDGRRLLYGFPNAESYPAFLRRLECDHTGSIPVWKRLLTPVAGIAAAPSRAAWSLLQPEVAAGRFGIEAAEVRPAVIAALAGRATEAAGEGLVRIERTAPWLAWRYSDRSGLGYRAVYALEEGAAAAAVVWRIEGGQALLAEMSGPTAPLAAAIGAALDLARREGARSAATLCSIPEVEAALRLNRFWRRGGQPLIVRPLCAPPLGANVHDHGRWRMVGGDFDVY